MDVSFDILVVVSSSSHPIGLDSSLSLSCHHLHKPCLLSLHVPHLHRQDPLSVCRLNPDLFLACSALQLGGPVELTCIFRTEVCEIGCGYCVAKRQSLVQLLSTKDAPGYFLRQLGARFYASWTVAYQQMQHCACRRAPRRTVSHLVPL